MARAVGDIDQQWVADTQLTITLASLASDTNLLAGVESDAYVFSTLDNVKDALLSGKITTGTSPTADRVIEIWVAAPINDTPTWPDVLDGTGSAETITSSYVKPAALKLAKLIATSGISNTVYYFHADLSIANLFGGVLPEQIVVFITHNTAQNLNATGSNHEISITPVYDNAKLS